MCLLPEPGPFRFIPGPCPAFPFTTLLSFAVSLGRFVLCGLDCTVWPSNATYVGNCFDAFTHVLAMSPHHGGHCQTPIMQSQTTTDAWVKHRRLLEDSLKKGGMDITVPVTLSFDKASNHANDKRPSNHGCLFVTAISHQQASPWMSSAAVSSGLIGPCQLIRVNEMQGFDPDNRFGAASRTEQCLGCHSILKYFERPFICRRG